MGSASGGGGSGLPRHRQENEKLCYTIPEAAALLGFSRNFGYELARRGEIPIIRFGKRMLVPRVALEKLLEKDTSNDSFTFGLTPKECITKCQRKPPAVKAPAKKINPKSI